MILKSKCFEPVRKSIQR